MARWFVAGFGIFVIAVGAWTVVQPSGLSGIGIAIVGLERMQPIVEWGAGLEPAVLRTVGLVAAGLGAFIVWSVWPRRRES